MLLLDNEDVRRVLTIEACLEALERAYVAQANGSCLTSGSSNT